MPLAVVTCSCSVRPDGSSTRTCADRVPVAAPCNELQEGSSCSRARPSISEPPPPPLAVQAGDCSLEPRRRCRSPYGDAPATRRLLEIQADAVDRSSMWLPPAFRYRKLPSSYFPDGLDRATLLMMCLLGEEDVFQPTAAEYRGLRAHSSWLSEARARRVRVAEKALSLVDEQGEPVVDEVGDEDVGPAVAVEVR